VSRATRTEGVNGSRGANGSIPSVSSRPWRAISRTKRLCGSVPYVVVREKRQGQTGRPEPSNRRIRRRCNNRASRNRGSRSTCRRRTEAAHNRPTNGAKAK
jgi:hypothetical protein